MYQKTFLKQGSEIYSINVENNVMFVIKAKFRLAYRI